MLQKKIDFRKFYRELERDGVRPTFHSSEFHKAALDNPDTFKVSDIFTDPEGRKMVEIRLRREARL